MLKNLDTSFIKKTNNKLIITIDTIVYIIMFFVYILTDKKNILKEDSISLITNY